jgi:hypothetical protein
VPAPAQPELPQVRVVDPDNPTIFLDYLWDNDLGGDLLLTANCGPMRNGAAVPGRCDLSIVPGTINPGAKTCTIRRRWRKASNASLLMSSWNDINGDVSGVLLDGETPYYNLVPGWQTVFNDLGVGIQDTHTAHITHGDYFGSFADGNPDAATPGAPILTKRLGFKNTGSTIAKNVVFYCNRPRLLYRLRAGDGGLAYARVTNASPVPKILANQIKPYKATWAVNAIDSALRDLAIDAATVAQLIRIADNNTVDSLGLSPGGRYRFVTTGLVGVEIKLAAAISASDRFNLLLWPPDQTKTSVDNSGSEVEYDDTDVLVGDLSGGALGYGWIQAFANVGSGLWNPIIASAGISYLNTGAAAIDED